MSVVTMNIVSRNKPTFKKRFFSVMISYRDRHNRNAYFIFLVTDFIIDGFLGK